jgi:hypothetical protein
MAFAAIVGVLLSLIFWLLDKIGVMNEGLNNYLFFMF